MSHSPIDLSGGTEYLFGTIAAQGMKHMNFVMPAELTAEQAALQTLLDAFAAFGKLWEQFGDSVDTSDDVFNC